MKKKKDELFMGMKIKIKVSVSELNAIQDAVQRGDLAATPKDDEEAILQLLGSIYKKTSEKVTKIKGEIDEYEVC